MTPLDSDPTLMEGGGAEAGPPSPPPEDQPAPAPDDTKGRVFDVLVSASDFVPMRAGGALPIKGGTLAPLLHWIELRFRCRGKGCKVGHVISSLPGWGPHGADFSGAETLASIASRNAHEVTCSACDTRMRLLLRVTASLADVVPGRRG